MSGRRTKYRDAVTGEYVTAEYAEANPDTTVTESQRVMTDEEAEAVATLVRGGWLKLELTTPDERGLSDG